MPDMTLADSTPNPPHHESENDFKWNELPTICSPRPGPRSHGLTRIDPSSPHLVPSPIPSYLHPTRETHETLPDGRLSRASSPDTSVPPSLLSPAFTPPTTPGVGPDRIEHVSKKPRLLENLPEVDCVVRARIPTYVIRVIASSIELTCCRTTGTEMFLHLYQNSIDQKEHLAIVFGPRIRSTSLDRVRPGETEMDRMIRGAYSGRLYPGRTTSKLDEKVEEAHEPPLVRIHSECYTGETAWSARCDCGEQLDEAARVMSMPSSGGVIIYLRQEGRGIGLGEKLKAYNLQDLGSDTVEANLLLRHPADARSYGLATAMLMDLGLHDIRLLTNNPEKVRAVEGPRREVRVVERIPMIPLAWRTGGKTGVQGKEVGEYLRTKIERMGHMLESEGVGPAGT